MTLTATDESILTDLMNSLSESKPKCEGTDCENDAQIMIMCPACQFNGSYSGEYSCLECYNALLEMDAGIVFTTNPNCLHHVPIHACPIRDI